MLKKHHTIAESEIMLNPIPKVAAIIVTWNKKNDVLTLLGQLQQISYPQNFLEIIVADNASSDGTAEAIEASYPHVHLIRHSENLGGAGGFNSGMRRATEAFPECDYLWLLDNDVTVDKNALTALASVMEKNPNAAICGSRIMNRDNPGELIEIGAFIDYRRGDIRRNEPNPDQLGEPEAVFEVDYVAACSLLARVSAVKQAGIWHEPFFIYWDDMEWGARFKSMGYQVIASNASAVYHPSWAGRVSDNTAIWRNYYRTRNSLWFFSRYTKGVRRRLLLSAMVSRYLLYAAHANVNSHHRLSEAFVSGISDYFQNRFGKKQFAMPPDDIEAAIRRKNIRTAAVFVPDPEATSAAQTFIRNLSEKFPDIRWIGMVPETDQKFWQEQKGFRKVFGYQRQKNGKISRIEKFRMLNFFRIQPWDLLMTQNPVPRMASVWRKPVACTDFGKSKTIAIEKMTVQTLLKIPFAGLSFFYRIWTGASGT